jgi:hypothetical protein
MYLLPALTVIETPEAAVTGPVLMALLPTGIV